MTDEFITERRKDADSLVEEYHYSHYIPSNIQFCTSLVRDNTPIASVFYSIPASRWPEEILELSRLVRNENINPKPMLTGLISQSVKAVRQSRKFNLIVSFADSTHNHHGGIYQASSWNYHTIRKSRLDGFIINDIFTAARTCNHRYGTSGMKLVKMLEEQGMTCVPHYDKGKHLYWKALDNNGEKKAERLGLTKSAYPKPNINE